MKKLMITATMVLLSAMNMMAQDNLTVSDFSIKAGETATVDIILNNSVAYTACQFDLILPTGVSIDKKYDEDEEDYVWNIGTPRFKTGHGLKVEKVVTNDETNRYRFIAYDTSLNNKTFKGESGTAIFTVTLKAETDMTEGNYEGKIAGDEDDTFPVFTEPNSTQHQFANVSFKITATSASGINEITIDNPADVYDLQGNKVRSNATSTDGLSKGVYIINGQKVIVK